MAKKKTEDVVKRDDSNITNMIDDLFKDDENYIRFSEIDSSITHWTDSGCYALNFLISNSFFKGYPNGRTTFLEGLASSGKSLLIATAMRDPTVDLSLVFETEGDGFSRDLLEFAKVDVSKVRQLKVRSYDCFKVAANGDIIDLKDSDYSPDSKDHEAGIIWKMQKTIDFIKQNKIEKKVIIGIDSFANLSSAKEIGGSLDMGKRNQLANKFFRLFDTVFNKLNIACLITNKLYTNVMAGQYEEKYISSGGVAPEYNSSLTLRLEKVANSNTLSDAENKAEKEEMKTARGASIVTVKVKITKSRLGTFGRQLYLQIDMNKGLPRYSGMLNLCSDYEVIERVGARYHFKNESIYAFTFFAKDFETLVKQGGEDMLRKIEAEIHLNQDKEENKVITIEDEVKEEEEQVLNEMIKNMN